ncbi:hypothetical protein U1Q18_010102, partial [Sarracenia purpurea var. burkii]
NWLCGGASTGGGSRSFSKILDLVSHREFVTGEWYIPGHMLSGFLAASAGGELSKGQATVEATGMVFREKSGRFYAENCFLEAIGKEREVMKWGRKSLEWQIKSSASRQN